jgi:hypothetical protein
LLTNWPLHTKVNTLVQILLSPLQEELLWVRKCEASGDLEVGKPLI